MNRNHLAGAVRERLKRYPPPDDSHYGVVPAPPIEDAILLESAQAVHGEAIAALGKADALAKAHSSHFLLSRILARREAVASSDIEGTHSTLDAVLEAEEGAIDASADDALVRDYAIALEAALMDVEANGVDAFTIHTMESLHRSLMQGDDEFRKKFGEPGWIRRIQVRIGGRDFATSIFNPPPYTEVLTCVAENIAYMRAEGMQALNQSIITRMAIAHSHFEAVHPFPDGNGRVGRLMLPLMLRAEGHTPLYLSPYIREFKPDYIDALKAAQQRLDYRPMIECLSRAIISTVDEAEESAIRLEALREDWLRRRKFRKGSAALILLDMLPPHPIVTAQTVARLTGASVEQSRRAIGQLVKVAILKERTGKKRYRVFEASEILEIYRGAEQPD